MERKNIKYLRDSLLDNYERMKKGEMPLSLGKELSNAAGKILGTVKAELEYNKQMDRQDEVGFLEYEREHKQNNT